MTSRATRTALTVAAATTLACAGVSGAHAATPPNPTAPAPLSSTDLAAATSAASSGEGLRLAATIAKKQSSAEQATTSPSTTSLRSASAPGVVPGTTTVVNTLTRDFVTEGKGPIARLAYVANSARVGDQVVSVWSVKAKNGSGWKAVNAAAGDLEARMAKQAGTASIFREPQINAFYAVKGSQVIPLNDAARNAVGSGMSMRDYQRLVHNKYASMMPGSTYDKSGMAGGFGQPAKAAAAGSTNTSASHGSQTGMLAAGGVGVLALAGAGTLVARRRSTQD